MTDFVYPGALHTRFHHALGSMHLMNEALTNLRKKDIEISDEEFTGALIAVLLHDVGHAPFSHALENELILGVGHEQISSIIMEKLNLEFSGGLDLATRIFNGTYKRKFFHQLVSSQLDIDRLDYLNRDSYFTGVVEGRIGSERIIKLLNVHEDELVVDEKGIYSIENFLSARRIMYWQVYIHKTTVGIEKMLIQIIRRVREIGKADGCSEELSFFINNTITSERLTADNGYLDAFCRLDDYDVIGGIKAWVKSDDFVLSELCKMFIERRLFNVHLYEKRPSQKNLQSLKSKVVQSMRIDHEQVSNFVIEGVKSNSAYIGGGQQIKLLTKHGMIEDIANASDLPNIKAMRKIVKKYYLCWPKNISLQPNV